MDDFVLSDVVQGKAVRGLLLLLDETLDFLVLAFAALLTFLSPSSSPSALVFSSERADYSSLSLAS